MYSEKSEKNKILEQIKNILKKITQIIELFDKKINKNNFIIKKYSMIFQKMEFLILNFN